MYGGIVVGDTKILRVVDGSAGAGDVDDAEDVGNIGDVDDAEDVELAGDDVAQVEAGGCSGDVGANVGDCGDQVGDGGPTGAVGANVGDCGDQVGDAGDG